MTTASPDFTAEQVAARQARLDRWLHRGVALRRQAATIWGFAHPLVRVAVCVAVLTYALGVYRYADLDSLRSTAWTRETLMAVVDATQSVNHAAELLGGNGYMFSLLLVASFTSVVALPLQMLWFGPSRFPRRVSSFLIALSTSVLVGVTACGLVAWLADLPTVLGHWPYQVAAAVVLGVWWFTRAWVPVYEHATVAAAQLLASPGAYATASARLVAAPVRRT